MKLACLAFATLVALSSFSTPFASTLFIGAPAAARGVEAQDDDGKKAKEEARKKREAEGKAAAKTLHEGLEAKEVNARRAAILEASETLHPAVIAEIATALRDDAPEVRRSAIEALGMMRHEDALEQLTKYSKKSKRTLATDLETHVTLIRAIGRHKDPGKIKWLMKGAVDAPEFELRQARVYSVANMRTPEALEALMAAMNKTDPRRLKGRMREFQPALVHITGVDRGKDPASWTAWWSENRKTFKIPEETPKVPGLRGDDWRRFWGEERTYERRKKRGDRG